MTSGKSCISAVTIPRIGWEYGVPSLMAKLLPEQWGVIVGIYR
jgi:hypothetical protein